MRQPPKKMLAFLRWFCREDYLDEIEGDLTEIFRKQSIRRPHRAQWAFAWSVLRYFRPAFMKSFKNWYQPHSYGMYKNYLKTAWRNITAKKANATINVAGLALGIACALLIFSLVTYHLDFDTFHHDSGRIYRFVTEEHRDQVGYAASVPPVFGKAFRDDYTFGEKVARLCTLSDQLITIEEAGQARKFNEEVAFVEPEFFDIFNFPLASGNRDKLLRDPNTALISERIAAKYFGSVPAIGKTFRFNNSIDFVVAGVLKDIPENTDLRSEIYFSYSTIKQYNEWYASDDAWGGITTDIQTFVRLRPGVTPGEVEQVLPAYVKKFRPKSKNVHHYKLQPLSDMHFNPNYLGKMSKTTLSVLSTVGLLLVFTACLNFINLATAQAVTRAKEVGVRKVMGSIRTQLFWQFTTETGVIVLLATVLACTVSYFAVPYLNALFNIHLTFSVFSDVRILLFLVILFLVVTILSGAYPGIILSGYKPVEALKGRLQTSQGGSYNIRRGLVIAQFAISQVLLIGLIVMFFQMKYFSQSDMGFHRQATVIIPVGSTDTKMKTLQNQYLAMPQVENVTACFAPPASESSWSTSIRFDNQAEPENFSISFKGADERYLSTFGIELVAGRNLTPSDTIREFLVNEKTVAKLGLASNEEILGKTMTVNGEWTAPVVGVIKDFHDQSLHSDIEPVFITTVQEYYNVLAVRINMADAPGTLAALEKAWSDLYPEQIYKFDFLDDQIAAFYHSEQVMLTLIQIFSAIALIIGCMGLYGMVSFMALQKTKEIGIRKVLGGSVRQILWIFGKEFSWLVMVAFLVAGPAGWFLMSGWLARYSYRIEMGVWVLALELFLILGVVLVTVGFRSWRAALANPVQSLRSE